MTSRQITLRMPAAFAVSQSGEERVVGLAALSKHVFPIEASVYNAAAAASHRVLQSRSSLPLPRMVRFGAAACEWCDCGLCLLSHSPPACPTSGASLETPGSEAPYVPGCFPLSKWIDRDGQWWKEMRLGQPRDYHEGFDEVDALNLDRPFAFVVQHKATRAILLKGSFYNPHA